jgi:hypothetical protein
LPLIMMFASSSLALSLRHGRRLVSPAVTTACRLQSTNASASISTSSNDESTAKEFEDRTLDTPLPPSTGTTTSTMMERSEKNIFAQFFDKYSVTQQTNRILVAESLLQAAIHQASDP